MPFFLSSLIWVYTICHSQQFDQALKLFAFLSSLIMVYTICLSQQSDQGIHYLPFSVWSGSTLVAIRSSRIRVYTFSHSHSDQGPLLAILSNLIRVCTICYSQQSDQGLHCLPFSAVWSGSTLFAILSSLIKVKDYTVFLGTVWSRSLLFAF